MISTEYFRLNCYLNYSNLSLYRISIMVRSTWCWKIIGIYFWVLTTLQPRLKYFIELSATRKFSSCEVIYKLFVSYFMLIRTVNNNFNIVCLNVTSIDTFYFSLVGECPLQRILPKIVEGKLRKHWVELDYL